MNQHIFKVRVVRSPAGAFTLYLIQGDRVVNSRGSVSQPEVPVVVLQFMEAAGLRFVGTIPCPETAHSERYNFYVVGEEK